MPKNSIKRFGTILWRLAILNWILAIMMLIINLPLAQAEVSKSKSTPEGKKYIWYKGGQEKYVWLADDEIAIFPKQRASRTRSVLEKTVKDLGFGGEVIRQNDFVLYMKLLQRRGRGEIERMTGELQDQGEIKHRFSQAV